MLFQVSEAVSALKVGQPEAVFEVVAVA